VSFTGAGGDLEARVEIKVDGKNYKRKIEKGIAEHPNRRIMFECIRKYADRTLWVIYEEISRQNAQHDRADEFNYAAYLEMGLQGHKKQIAHMM
jgi:hypothetical protein